jgi:FtsP/CotA-like multicopper oxidase with cupredoxin domain
MRSAGGVLDITMTAAPAEIDIGAAMPVRTSAYDAALPGSTWELDPGDTLRVLLINDLPPLDHPDDSVELDRPHEWTTTNLHTHGLHVSPEGDGDNVFVAIAPGERHQYEIEVPADHPGGLFWYHPHRHGGVAQQIRGGMAGAIVVRGELDAVPEVAAAKERLMVIQAIELDDVFVVPEPIPNPSRTEAFFPRSQILYPINGVIDPTITMRPGELQRWRILNAAEGKFINLVVDGVELHVLAWDGLTLAAPDPVPNLFLSPGNRVDVLVRADAAGTRQLELTPSSSQRPGSEGVPSPTTSSLPPELVTRSIASVVIEGEPVEMALPAALPEWDPPILPIARRRQLEFTVEREGLEFLTFGVDGEPFVPTQTPYRVQLDTAEEWTLVNGVDEKLPQHAHTFHIHVNPFKVTRVNGVALERPLWRDTFILTGTTGDSFTFETNFVDFTGRFVDHCHVVSHEDLGMMEIVEVVP